MSRREGEGDAGRALSPEAEGVGSPRSGAADRDAPHDVDRRGSQLPVVEYEPGTTFPGVIGRTADESSPAWPAPARPEAGTANVLFIVLDDTGFGQLGCYGSPIETPNLDGLAAGGLLFNNMHTTA